ncbi:MAG: SiaB family protein kinase [Bacteroidales bacterium]|nr:SiaB family protein kinase [Bacteroidales bacterium]
MDKDLIFIQTILSDEMVANGFPVVYKGKLNHEILKLFTSMAEAKVSQGCSNHSIRRKVFHVIVECVQNITRHSDDYDEDGIGNGIFVVGERKDFYYVITGNIIKSHKVRKLEEKLEKLNSMADNELLKLHKTQMLDGELSEKGGAGLGLIDMIRKTGEKYIYQFLKLDMENHFFILKVTVPKIA